MKIEEVTCGGVLVTVPCTQDMFHTGLLVFPGTSWAFLQPIHRVDADAFGSGLDPGSSRP